MIHFRIALIHVKFRYLFGNMNNKTYNVLQLSIGFFLIFLAFNSAGFIEETVIASISEEGHIDKHAGYISLAIIYGFFTFSVRFSSLIIQKLEILELLGGTSSFVFGCKMVISTGRNRLCVVSSRVFVPKCSIFIHFIGYSWLWSSRWP